MSINETIDEEEGGGHSGSTVINLIGGNPPAKKKEVKKASRPSTNKYRGVFTTPGRKPRAKIKIGSVSQCC